MNLEIIIRKVRLSYFKDKDFEENNMIRQNRQTGLGCVDSVPEKLRVKTAREFCHQAERPISHVTLLCF